MQAKKKLEAAIAAAASRAEEAKRAEEAAMAEEAKRAADGADRPRRPSNVGGKEESKENKQDDVKLVIPPRFELQMDKEKLKKEFKKSIKERRPLTLTTINSLCSPFNCREKHSDYGPDARLYMLLIDLLEQVSTIRGSQNAFTSIHINNAINTLLGTSDPPNNITKGGLVKKWERAIVIRMNDLRMKDKLRKVPTIHFPNPGLLCPDHIGPDTFVKLSPTFGTKGYDACGPSASLGLRLRELQQMVNECLNPSNASKSCKATAPDATTAIKILCGANSLPSTKNRTTLFSKLLQIVKNMRDNLKAVGSLSKAVAKNGKNDNGK